MKRSIIVVVLLGAIGAGAAAYYMKRQGAADAASTTGPATAGRGRQGGQGGFGGAGGVGGFGGGARLPMTVELAAVKRADMKEDLAVVGNLVGAVTVEAVPKVS